MNGDDLYSTHADTIDAVIKAVCRRHRLTADRADDLTSLIHVKLLENDRAVLRQFQGRSSIRTYLVTVAERVLLDWRTSEWGKWRPCQEARRLGEVAIDLDRLLTRDKMPYEEAVEMLLAQGRAASRAELDEIRPKLSPRTPRQVVGGETLEHLPARVGAADERVTTAERTAQASKAGAALAAAFAELPPSDQVIVRMRFQDGFTVARIAELLGEEQKPLYRRFEKIFARMRESLGRSGLSEDRMADFFRDLDGPEPDLGPVLAPVGGGKPRPSPSTAVTPGGPNA